MNTPFQKQTGLCQACPTRQVCLAKDLNSPELDKLESLIQPSSGINKSEYIYHAGNQASHHYYVRSGMLKSYAINASGDEYITGFYLPGEILGCAQSDGKHSDSALALETSTVCKLAETDIQHLSKIGVATTLFTLLAEREELRNQHILNLCQARAEARVAGFLIDMTRRLIRLGRCPNHIPTPMSRTDLANYLGITLETLSRALSRLVKTGILHATKGQIEIKNYESIQLLGLHMQK